MPLLSASIGKAGSRGVKSSSTPGPTSRSFRPSTEGKEEEVRTGVTQTLWGMGGDDSHPIHTNIQASGGIMPPLIPLHARQRSLKVPERLHKFMQELKC